MDTIPSCGAISKQKGSVACELYCFPGGFGEMLIYVNIPGIHG